MNEWQAAAENARTALWGAEVSCTITDTFRDKGRNRVYRLVGTGGPVTSVILKACLGDEENPYVLGDDAPWRAFRRFCNEWTGCAMLAPLGLGPTAYTGDAYEHRRAAPRSPPRDRPPICAPATDPTLPAPVLQLG